AASETMSTLMSEPVCLIENDETNQLVINKEALQILTSITEPLVVVAIVGKYRTGKSYLMNNLAGRKKGESHLHKLYKIVPSGQK
uniref:GB1/RHD3-type G domain-containing protein n=1 Tax=Leptobrachium leishanense TaxID=445787 RepID=A0A8C5WHS2_9ANUR